MKIVNTFIEGLYAFKYSDSLQDELERIFDEWENPLFLNDFFEENEYNIFLSIEEAIKKVKTEAVFLRNKLIDLSESNPNKLNQIFKNLNENEFSYSKELSQQKARNRWLRIYAIKIDSHNYVITGGAIKLDNQHLMKDQPHTNKEWIKLNRCRDYLREQGIYDIDSLQEILF